MTTTIKFFYVISIFLKRVVLMIYSRRIHFLIPNLTFLMALSSFTTHDYLIYHLSFIALGSGVAKQKVFPMMLEKLVHLGPIQWTLFVGKNALALHEFILTYELTKLMTHGKHNRFLAEKKVQGSKKNFLCSHTAWRFCFYFCFKKLMKRYFKVSWKCFI